jgi:hypothetical protein
VDYEKMSQSVAISYFPLQFHNNITKKKSEEKIALTYTAIRKILTLSLSRAAST